jgi:hypothetical protein
METKEITFEGNYTQDSRAIEWLLNLSKCFEIKKVELKSYISETKYTHKFKTKIKVRYE